MAFTDPQKIKVDGSSEVELPRVNTGSFSSEYLSNDSTVRLRFSTQDGKRKRHMARVDLSKIAANPLDTDMNEEISSSIYLVVDRPKAGYTNEELRKAVEGLFNLLSASTYASTKKLLGSES